MQKVNLKEKSGENENLGLNFSKFQKTFKFNFQQIVIKHLNFITFFQYLRNNLYCSESKGISNLSHTRC